MEQTKWIEIATPDSIADGDYKVTTIHDEGLEIVVFNINNQFFAIENRCPHQNLPLADGSIENNNITCPFHGAVFSLSTGEAKVHPDADCENLKIFPIKIENNLIKINIL